MTIKEKINRFSFDEKNLQEFKSSDSTDWTDVNKVDRKQVDF